MVQFVLPAAIALVGILQSLSSAPAQTYPARMIRFIVLFGAATLNGHVGMTTAEYSR